MLRRIRPHAPGAQALVWDMMRRIRRGRVRADINEELRAEEQAAAAVEATEVDDQDIERDENPPR